MNSLYNEHRRQNLADQERHESRVRREIEEAEARREFDDRYAPLATMSDAHAEWHRNSGVPMGQPGCPQDACHPIDDYDYEPEVTPVRCGNIRAHGRGAEVYHDGAAGVRACYQGVPGAALNQVTREGQHLITHQQVADSVQKASEADVALSITTEQAVAQMRANEEAARQQAARQRYAAWRSIPVYGAHNRGYYALRSMRNGEPVIDFYRVERPTEGKHAGKTFVKRQSSDSFDRMDWNQSGDVLDRIAQDSRAAGVLYGQEIGRCYRCHRTLTDPDSRAAGIGSDCAKKEGR